ncbi:annexin A7/11 [Paragonimus westermani]|uniref:Annexin n=1 Tax=Paragonimus westermani TaxID=34504 RepID=A0A5J4NSR2_9TREM|nr:annexin A7/11 [Paragonimus westermani]
MNVNTFFLLQVYFESPANKMSSGSGHYRNADKITGEQYSQCETMRARIYVVTNFRSGDECLNRFYRIFILITRVGSHKCCFSTADLPAYLSTTPYSFGLQRSWFHKIDRNGKLLRPTIGPTPGFSASADAERLHRAMKGAGTDEDTLINILARRTNHERQEICASYESHYKKTLKEDIKSDTSGQFKTVLCELCLDAPYMLAKSLYYAMKGIGTNERVFIEVMCTLWNDEMKAVEAAYLQDPKRTLLTDLTSETSGDFQYALTLLAQAQRDDIPAIQLKAISQNGVQSVVNKELADSDAKELLAAGASKVGTNEKRISRIVCGRTPFQLAADAEAYARLFGKSLLEDMNSELSGDYRTLVLTLIRYATDRPGLIAEWLKDAMQGIGTRDYTVMRLLITRSEIDLEDVKEAYAKNYGQRLVDKVKNDTSGDYRRVLVKLLGEE